MRTLAPVALATRARAFPVRSCAVLTYADFGLKATRFTYANTHRRDRMTAQPYLRQPFGWAFTACALLCAGMAMVSMARADRWDVTAFMGHLLRAA